VSVARGARSAGLDGAASEKGQLLHGDRMHQRVGVSVHQAPVGVLAPEDQRHSQGPVLSGQAGDRAVLSLHPHQDREVARRVLLDKLEVPVSSAGEGLLERVDAGRMELTTATGGKRVPGTLVCGVNDSDDGRRALELAVALSERLGLRLVLAHISDDIAPVAGVGDGAESVSMKRAARAPRACSPGWQPSTASRIAPSAAQDPVTPRRLSAGSPPKRRLT
jgi:hypothetical protein